MIYLPVAEGIHPEKVIHYDFKIDGKPHSEYNKKMGILLDGLEKRAVSEKWDDKRAAQEVLKLQKQTRQKLNSKRGGKCKQ